MEFGGLLNEAQEPSAQDNIESNGPAEGNDKRCRSLWQKQAGQSKSIRAACYIITIIVNLIVLYVANNLLNWHVPFLTREFTAVLPVLTISITATIIANLAFLLYDSDWFLALARSAINVIGVVVAYTFYTTFPLDFSSLASAGFVMTVAGVVLILGIIGSVIGVIVEFSKFIGAMLRG
jgi:hypothetical protein